MRLLCAIAGAFALAGLCLPASAQNAYVACDAVGPAKPICGFQNPEDLAPLPGNEVVLVSEYGAMEGGTPGRLALLVLANEERRPIYAGGGKRQPTPGWGDPACPGEPTQAFSPHGIDVLQRPDGSLALAVVQHGGRESIELFELTGSRTAWSAVWRGCVLAPDDAWLNEVVLVPGGELLTTNMMSRAGGLEQMMKAPTEPTGFVYSWSAVDGFREEPGSRGMMPNGIEVSSDGKTVLLNLSMENSVRRIDRATGKVTGVAEVTSPDNSTWSPDGKKLLVASLNPIDPEAFAGCQKVEQGSCAFPFKIVSVDPISLATEVVYVGDGPPMGAGTVGLQVGNELFIGSFRGDRVLRVQLGDTN